VADDMNVPTQLAQSSDIVTRLLALNHPDAADGRASADRLAEAAEMAGPVLDDAAYREALHQARKTGGEAAAAGVRRAQRAARLRVAATPANAAAATTTVADESAQLYQNRYSSAAEEADRG